MLRKLLALAVLCVAGMVSSHPAKAQSSAVILPNGCGTANYYTNTGYLTIDSTGKLCTSGSGGGGGGTSSNFNSAFPTAGTAIGFSNGTNMVPGLVDGSGFLKVNVAAGGSTGTVFGPTAVGSANANPPVVIGGTATGAAGQNVEGVAVKPASTASVATDLSLVTNESPNSQLSTAIGTTADSAWVSGSGTMIALLKNIATGIANAIATGTNYIGQIGSWVVPTSYLSGTTAAMTGTTSTQLLAAVASKKLYVLSISCVNSHATQGTFVTVQDGSGGTALATLAAAAVYGGDEKTSVGPLFSTTSGNGLFVADVTTGANVICNANGFAQ